MSYVTTAVKIESGRWVYRRHEIFLTFFQGQELWEIKGALLGGKPVRFGQLGAARRWLDKVLAL